MSYTPPAGDSLSAELAAIPGAYSSPAADSLSYELAATGGAGGQITFILAPGNIALSAYGPSKFTVNQHIDVTGNIAVGTPQPTSHVFKQTNISAEGSISVAGWPAVSNSTKTTQISAEGNIALSTPQPTFFKGTTQQIDSVGVITVTGYADVVQTKVSHTSVPSGSIAVSVPQPIQKVSHTLGVAGNIPLAGWPVSYKQIVRNSILGKYFAPSINMDVSGEIVISGNSPTFKYKIRQGMVGQYSVQLMVHASIASPYTFRMSVAVAAPYSVTGRVATDVAGIYSTLLIDKVAVGIVAGYRNTISTGVVSGYSSISYTKVRGSIESRYTYFEIACKSIASKYNMTSGLVAAISSPYKVIDILRATAAVKGIYSLPDYSVIPITSEPYMEYFGERVKITTADINISEDEYAWKASVVLARISDYAKMKQDQPFAIVIGGERYEFIVDSKQLSRGAPANAAAMVLGISPSAKLNSPRHVSTTYLWDTYVSSADVAQELAPGIVWGILDWTIPAYRLGAQNATPISVLKILAAAVGGLIETRIDGSLYARPRYPVSVPDYATATVDHYLTEGLDILKVDESYLSSETFNRLIISDVQQSIADSIEWIPDYQDAQTGIVRAYIYPWRSAVQLEHTGAPSVTIAGPELGMVQHEEIIEVFQGTGSTQYPIHHIDSVTYEASNIGSIVFDTDSRDFTVSGPLFNSVIKIVYWTRSLDYRVALPEGRPTQFLLESDPL